MRDFESELVVKKLCSKLAELRKDSGLSVEGLAHVAGLSSATISHLENFNRIPKSLTLIKICKALETKPSKVFHEIGE